MTFQVFQFPQDKIPRIDGDTSDWDIVPDSYAIKTDQFTDDTGKHPKPDPANLDVKIRVGWVKGSSRLYFLYEASDNYWDFAQPGLVSQLDGDREVEHARQGRVVHRKQRALRRRDGQFLGEPVERLRRNLAVVVSRHRCVERDDTQAIEVVAAVHWSVRRHLAEQAGVERCPVVVVAHHPDDLGADPFGHGIELGFESLVGVRFGEVGEVAGDHDRARLRAGAFELLERDREVAVGVDSAVERTPPAEEMGVGDVGDDVRRRCVLPELDHVWTLNPTTVRGGHAVCIVGYTADRFIVRNSWGTGWGDGGFAYVTDSYVLAAFFTESYGITM